MNSGSVLEVQGVSVRFGGLTALDAVSLFVPPRHVLGVIGPNGAGKTTLLNVLCGFIRPDAGEVLFGGRRPDIRPHRLASLGVARTLQGVGLYGGLTGRRHLPRLGRVLVRAAVAPAGQPGRAQAAEPGHGGPGPGRRRRGGAGQAR